MSRGVDLGEGLSQQDLWELVRRPLFEAGNPSNNSTEDEYREWAVADSATNAWA